MTATLLPPSRTATEAAFDLATARVGTVPVQIDTLWRSGDCPQALLPWLAWALSVDTWDPRWSDEAKRASIREAIEIHRRKGTRSSVQRVLRAAGYGDAILTESESATVRDGSIDFDGASDRARTGHWAEYRLTLRRAVTIRQARQVRAMLAVTAPARCHLRALDYTEVPRLRDGTILYDATYTHGVS